MKHIIRTGNSGKDILITHQVAPDNSHGWVAKIRLEHPAVLLAVTSQNPYVEPVPPCIKLLKARPAHIAGGSCKEYCLLCLHKKMQSEIQTANIRRFLSHSLERLHRFLDFARNGNVIPNQNSRQTTEAAGTVTVSDFPFFLKAVNALGATAGSLPKSL